LGGSVAGIVALSEEASRSTRRIVNRLARGGRHGAVHRPDNLSRREELASVVPLLPHLQEQVLVHLGEREDVDRVNGLRADLMDFVDHVEEVPLGVDPGPFDAGHDFADDPLAGTCAGPGLQPLQIRKKLAVDETEEPTQSAVLELDSLRPVRRGPIAPAVGRLE